MSVSSEQRHKDKPFDLSALAGPQQIELSVPVRLVDAVGIGGTTGGRIDHRVHTIQGVIEAVWLEQVTTGELAAPFLQKRRLSRGANHAADVVSGIKGTAGNLSSKGARATQHQNLHGALA